MVRSWRIRAQALKQNVHALYLASRDPRVPRGAKILLVVTVAYAASPIDLIPDFIPVLGYLDDLVILPLAIAWTVKLIPREIWQECKAKARRRHVALHANLAAAAVIVVVWLCGIVLLSFFTWLWLVE